MRVRVRVRACVCVCVCVCVCACLLPFCPLPPTSYIFFAKQIDDIKHDAACPLLLHARFCCIVCRLATGSCLLGTVLPSKLAFGLPSCSGHGSSLKGTMKTPRQSNNAGLLRTLTALARLPMSELLAKVLLQRNWKACAPQRSQKMPWLTTDANLTRTTANASTTSSTPSHSGFLITTKTFRKRATLPQTTLRKLAGRLLTTSARNTPIRASGSARSTSDTDDSPTSFFR